MSPLEDFPFVAGWAPTSMTINSAVLQIAKKKKKKDCVATFELGLRRQLQHQRRASDIPALFFPLNNNHEQCFGKC